MRHQLSLHFQRWSWIDLDLIINNFNNWIMVAWKFANIGYVIIKRYCFNIENILF